ncbi:unnamed protein product [Rhizoctonia solani]|nr:unnamed protein product [Rhizoctonia solani]
MIDEGNPQERSFPALETIQLSKATILVKKGFQDMVASHPLRRIALGGTSRVASSDEIKQGPLEKRSSMCYQGPQSRASSSSPRTPPAVGTIVNPFRLPMDTSNYLPRTPAKPSKAPTPLVDASNDHMGPSASPTPGRSVKVENVDNLATTIDSTIKIVSDQLLETKRALGWTQNKLVSPIHRLPEEVVSTILMDVVFGFNHSGIPDSTLMEQDIYVIYRRLYQLLGVCSTWRGIIRTRGVFWSAIPVVVNPVTKKLGPFELSLKRAGGSNLHLVAVANSELMNISKDLIAVLTKYGHHFHSINLSIADRQILVDALDKLLQESNIGLLTKLSIRFINAFNNLSLLPSDDSYIFHHDDPRQNSFIKLVGALSVFRIHGVHFHWQTAVFSTRLVELWIENITLGCDDAVVPFLQALSSASELRDLKIITVDTFYRNTTSSTSGLSSRIVFPNLQLLYLRDIYCNTLKSLLQMIAPGSYRLTFFLRETSLHNNLYEQNFDDVELDHPEVELAEIGELCEALEGVPVHTLMLSEHLVSGRLTGPTLQVLLKAMPTLKTLKMHRWVFDEAVWSGLKRPQDNQDDHQERSFPALEHLQLVGATILTDEGFQDMVASHPMQQVMLGGTIASGCSDDTTQRPFEEGNRTVTWLRGTVPNFRLVGDRYCPPEFQPVRWSFSY